jgi:phospholipase/carboxylesterase
MTGLLPCVEVVPAGEPAGVVVWLHGLGASGHDFEGIVPLLDQPRLRFVFPHAPRRPVTINGGLVMPAWYDVAYLGGTATGGEDEVGVWESERAIAGLIDRERQYGVLPTRIVLAGFSQGGAMALFAGTRYPEPLAGIMVLSGYELAPERRDAEEGPANRATPMLFCHGSADPLVDVQRGRQAYEAHARSGRPAEWREFPVGHELSIDEIRVIREWLAARLPPPPS